VEPSNNGQHAMSNVTPVRKSLISLLYSARVATGVLKHARRNGDRSVGMIRDFLFLVLFFFFLAIWLVSWLAFHVAGGFIHLLLIVAIISLVLHLFRGSKTA
jgi:hypothetical protein